MIDSYEFGSIVIEGKAYDSDCIVFPGKVDTTWWRRESHSVCIEDLKVIIEYKPDLLIVGTGSQGLMSVPKDTIFAIEAHGIQVMVCKTDDAVKKYNHMFRSKKMVGAFHLTC